MQIYNDSFYWGLSWNHPTGTIQTNRNLQVLILQLEYEDL